MEMNENIYPNLPNPSAPPIDESDDKGHSYRLKVISDVEKFLENEFTKRDAFSNKYFRIAKITTTADITLGAGVTGAALLATVVAAAIALGLEIAAAATGLISLLGNAVVWKTTTKAEKHLKIKMLASAK